MCVWHEYEIHLPAHCNPLETVSFNVDFCLSQRDHSAVLLALIFVLLKGTPSKGASLSENVGNEQVFLCAGFV